MSTPSLLLLQENLIVTLWDTLFGVMLPLVMGIVVLGALCLGVIRLALMAYVVTQYRPWKSSQFQKHVDSLAHQFRVKNVRILLCTRERPLAFTYGVLRPTVLLSTWMVTQLDLRELEAVLTHELEHVARRDYLIVWFATVLRDAFFYLPTSRMAYRQLQQEKEFACDDMAVEVTHRPLALASAFHSLALDTIPEGPSSHLCAAAMAFSSVTVVGKILLHLLLALQVITIYYW